MYPTYIYFFIIIIITKIECWPVYKQDRCNLPQRALLPHQVWMKTDGFGQGAIRKVQANGCGAQAHRHCPVTADAAVRKELLPFLSIK